MAEFWGVVDETALGKPIVEDLKSIRRRYVEVSDDRNVRARLEISHPPNINDDIVYALVGFIPNAERTKRKTNTLRTNNTSNTFLPTSQK